MAEAKSMTKTQIIKTLSEKTGHSKKEVIAFIEEFNALAYKEAKSSGRFTVPGFGILKKVKKKATKARMGRNPATGEAMQIGAKPAKTVVKFTLSKICKESIVPAKN